MKPTAFFYLPYKFFIFKCTIYKLKVNILKLRHKRAKKKNWAGGSSTTAAADAATDATALLMPPLLLLLCICACPLSLVLWGDGGRGWDGTDGMVVALGLCVHKCKAGRRLGENLKPSRYCLVPGFLCQKAIVGKWWVVVGCLV